MRCIWCGLLCLLLVGCNDIFATATTGQDLAACEVEAIKVYPNWRNAMSNMDTSSLGRSGLGGAGVGGAADMGDLTFLCMMAKGYAVADSCRPAKDAPEKDQWKNETTERCYRK